ncbi:unnamed protein product [Parnassius apollo]|uniref:(apollo) hypothetical protein n=1 Tax=Parnassius apollo TaxID=110799 RepID=A0A8S3W3G5_PARAO|nr:unnamed protein product [Parnassius apollo]
MRFKCCHEYPDKPPKISVKSMHGLSLENANKLLKELEELASQQCGEVMIFQLAHHTQQFLHEHNRPTLSFYEQMVQQKTELEEMKQRDLEVKANEEVMKMRAEILKRQETLRDLERSDEDVDDAPRLLCYAETRGDAWVGAGDAGGLEGAGEVGEEVGAVSEGDARSAGEGCTCGTRALRTLRYSPATNKKIYLGNCLGHSRHATSYLGLDESGGAVLVRRWLLPGATDVARRERRLAAVQRDVAAAGRAVREGVGVGVSALVPYRAVRLLADAGRGARHHRVRRAPVRGGHVAQPLRGDGSSLPRRFRRAAAGAPRGTGTVLCAGRTACRRRRARGRACTKYILGGQRRRQTGRWQC